MKSNVDFQKPISRALAAAMLLTSFWAASRVLAEEPVRTEVVKFHDLNVNSAEGAQLLYGRIHAAAKRVCSETDPLLQAGAIACARKAETAAVEKLNLSQLTAYYKIKTKTGAQMQPLVAAR
jgi:UrcA family protein